MKTALLSKIKIVAAGVFALSALMALDRAAVADDACPGVCAATFAGRTDLACCGHACDVDAFCKSVCSCGNGAIDSVCGTFEQCDDGNKEGGDGCDADCKVEVSN
ncbi:MAG TPA: hypothetical protein VFX30_10820 [bacterium]|nr:hypothetical protein [bacterium]